MLLDDAELYLDRTIIIDDGLSIFMTVYLGRLKGECFLPSGHIQMALLN